MRPQVGQVIHNKYRLLRLIGDGGMGSVFEARHEVLGTTVALKFLHPELSRRSGLVERFLQEARVSAQIQSPHVVRVTDVDRNETGQAFIVMEYLEGKTLQTLYEELYHARQRLSYADALEYAMQMLEGVEAAHSAGVVHRDLKPDNVIIARGKKGEPLLKLLDFGIAKLKVTGQLDRGLTRPGIIMGTPEYMAPEQAYSADAVDARADIFSLGVMIFEMLAGRRPVGGDEPHQIATAYLTRNIAKLLDLAPHVPAELAAAIHRAMGPKPEDRFGSVAELRAAIEPFWLATRPAATPVPPGTSLTPAPASPSAALASPVEGVRRVPKTLPPEDEAPAAQAPSGGQSIEVVFSAASPEGARASGEVNSAPATTPVSKMPHFDEIGGTPLPAGPAVSLADKGDQPINGVAAFARTDADVQPVMPGTVEAQPLFPGPRTNIGSPAAAAMDGKSTVQAPPLGLEAAQAPTADMPMPARPGGTAVGGTAFVPPGGTQSPGAYGAPMASPMPATASMDPLPMPYTPAPATRQASGRGTGGSLALILLAAGALSAAVVGGVYFAHQHAKDQDKTDDPVVVTTPPPATVPSDPGTANIPSKMPSAKPTVASTHPQSYPHPTAVPSQLPSSTPSATPSSFPTGFPTSFPTAIPTSLIPIPLPTSLPFPFPGQQQQPPAQPTSDPGKQPPFHFPSPQPSNTGGSTKPQIIIKFPKGSE
jgi:serine/threonine-protein kinase